MPILLLPQSSGAAGTNVNAEVATGTGAALVASVLIAVSAGLASGTGTAHNATVQTSKSVSAGLASGTGAANNATTLVVTNAGLASGTGSANQARASVAVNAGHASGSGAANNATVSTASFTSANAGLAAGTGTANQPSASIAPRAALASGSVGEIAFVSRAAAGTNTVALPSFQVGDVAIVSAFRTSSNTPPTVPGTFTTIDASTGANTCSQSTGYRILQSGDTSIGTWTNASSVQVLIFRNAHPVDPIGASAVTGASSNQINYPALTLQNAEGKTWSLGLAGHRTATDVGGQAVTGMTTRSTGSASIGAHTDENVTAFASTNYDGVVNASSGWRSTSVEILSRGATGTANDATVATAKLASAGLASGTGAAGDIDPITASAPNIATGTGNAHIASTAIKVNARLASGTGTANNATASTATFVSANAGHASGTGAANQPRTSIAVNVGAVGGTGTAHNATTTATGEAKTVNAGLAAGTGTAYNATVSTGAVGEAEFRGGRTVILKVRKLEVYAECAQGVGVAYGATCEWNDDEYALALLLGAAILR